MINYNFNPFDRTERSLTMTLIDLINRDEFAKEKDAIASPKNDDAQGKMNGNPHNPDEEKEIEIEQEFSSGESIAQNTHGVNIPNMFGMSEPPLDDILIEIGLKGFTKESESATTLKPACRVTFEKWYSILGYKDFKDSILAIHKSKIPNGKKWNQMLVKDVCYFVYYYHSRNYFINFDILSKCLGSYRNGRAICPNDIIEKITQDNAGDTVRSLYDSWRKEDENSLPEIDDGERRRELR